MDRLMFVLVCLLASALGVFGYVWGRVSGRCLDGLRIYRETGAAVVFGRRPDTEG